MNTDTILLYTMVSFFYVISPGPAVFLVIANGMGNHSTSVLLSSFGNICGLFTLSLVSIVGLGALIVTSSTLFLFVKVVGSSYLVYLGIKQFKVSRRFKSVPLMLSDKSNRRNISYFLEGFVLASTNPKPILFFISIFPQFLNINVSIAPQFFTLTSIFMIISFSSLFTYGYLAKAAKNIFSNSTFMTWFHRITGGLFIGMGIGLLQLK